LNTTKLRNVANNVIGRAERKLFGARDAAAGLIGDVTEWAQAIFSEAVDLGVYNNARSRANYALRQINGPAKCYVPTSVAWTHVWASAVRDMAALHKVIGLDDERGSDGFTLSEVRFHAADLADALGYADLAAYDRIIRPKATIKRRPAAEHIEVIAGDRLDRAREIVYNPAFADAPLLDELMDDLRPVCGRGVRALALLRGYRPDAT
jgi:hypothetical protein